MQANFSLILNVILLIGVVIAIGRLIKLRRRHDSVPTYQPPLVKSEYQSFDDIIAVRKISAPILHEEDPALEKISHPEPSHSNDNREEAFASDSVAPVMMFLLSKDNRHFAGYELLQTLFAAGLKFGEGQLFHRHQYPNGKGPILCSLAAATSTGVFDLQNIGGFSTRGLCLFMQPSGNFTIDKERFGIMLEIGKQLSDELDALLLDDRKQPLTEDSIAGYQEQLTLFNIKEVETNA